MHFLVFGQKDNFLPNRKCSFGPQKLEKVLFHNENSTGEIWHTFSYFWRKRKENEAILTKQLKKRLGPKELEEVLFYNRKSTGKQIWHTFSCFWRKRKENETILTKNRKFVAWAPKNRKSVIFTIGIQQEKTCIHFCVFGEKEKKIKQF